MRILLPITLATLLAGACAQAPHTEGPHTAPTNDRAAPRSRGPITRAELDTGTSTDLLSAVQRLRPSWLRVGTPRIYMGTAPVGVADMLREINPNTVETLDYLSPNQAIARYGRGHEGGVIIVTLRS